MNTVNSFMTRLSDRFDCLLIRVALFLGRVYWKSMPKQEKSATHYPSYDHFSASRRRLAAGKLASMVPILIGESAPCTLGGVPSWLLDFATDERPFVPPLDVVFPRQGLIFSLAPRVMTFVPYTGFRATSLNLMLEQGYSSPVPGADRNLLEDLFSRRLNLGPDTEPLIPIFCDPEEVLCCSSLDTLALVINRAWQESLKWGLAQLPPVPDVAESLIESQIGTGNWVDRRIFIEEATFSALFPLGNDAKSSKP